MDMMIRSNIRQFIKALDVVQRKQVPFALSQALNDTAFDVRSAEVDQAQRVFNNRKNWWSNRRTGFQVETASKKQGIGMKATIRANAYFAELQEHGGIKTPRGRRLAIPTEQAPKSLRRSDGVRRAKENAKVFVNSSGVYQRTSKRKIKRLFSFAAQATVTPRFGFEKTAKLRTQARIGHHFNRRLEAALRTARL
jgi:hypothetical protein